MSNDRVFLPYGRQRITPEDIDAVVQVLRSDYLTTGPAVEAFERAFADATGAPHAVVCSSGTAALHLAAMCLGLAPGDGVIVPTITFLATANAPHAAGAEIVFADVDPDSGLLTAESTSRALARASARGLRVRAVLPVHLNGQCADLEGIRDCLGPAREVAIVEDACHALGGRYPNGGPVGGSRIGELACFSFHPVKTITSGEGGMITTRSERRASEMRRLRNHGMVRDADAFTRRDLALDADGAVNPWYYEMASPGHNYRATDIACALGQSQLDRLDEMVQGRSALVDRYRERLAALVPLVRPLGLIGGGRPAWHLSVALVDFEAAGTTRARVMRSLAARGIGTQVHYIPVHQQPYYRDRYGDLELSGADAYYRRSLSLPLFPEMTPGDVDRVVEALAEAVGA